MSHWRENLKIRKEIATMENECMEYRRILHQIPETGFDTEKTWQKIKQLSQLSADECVKNGGVFFLEGKMKKCIAFRCELDGLNIKENNDHAYSSVNDNMHACGHDGHMAAMLLLMKYLISHQDQLICSVLFIFQPAEESGAGALSMIENHLFEKYEIKAMIAAHVMPDIAENQIACRAGALMAKSCEFTIAMKGKSAHAGSYWQGLDCIEGMYLLMNMIGLQIQDPLKSHLLHIGWISGGEVRNSVADHAQCEGTLRSFDEEQFLMMKMNLMNCVNAWNEIGYDCSIDFSYGYECVINDEGLVNDLKYVCESDYIETEQRLFSEDFSFYGQKVPALFYFCGIKKQEEVFLHSPDFDFQESALLKIVEVNVRLLEFWHLFQ